MGTITLVTWEKIFYCCWPLSSLFWGLCRSMFYLLSSLGILLRESPLSSQQPGQLKQSHTLLLAPFLFLSVCTSLYLLHEYCRSDHGLCVSSFPCLFSNNFFAVLGDGNVKSGVHWELDLPRLDHLIYI